jgi:hypothetical protein
MCARHAPTLDQTKLDRTGLVPVFAFAPRCNIGPARSRETPKGVICEWPAKSVQNHSSLDAFGFGDRMGSVFALPDHFGSLKEFTSAGEKTGSFYPLPGLETASVGPISKLPVSVRLVLESVLRNYDGKKSPNKTSVRRPIGSLMHGARCGNFAGLNLMGYSPHSFLRARRIIFPEWIMSDHDSLTKGNYDKSGTTTAV